jgi:hypothetical protein
LGAFPALLTAAGAVSGLAAGVGAAATVLLAVGLASSLVLASVGAGTGSIWGWWRSLRGSLPKNYYGLCSGLAGATTGGPSALSEWLCNLLDELAGRPGAERPLLFGDLWGKGGAEDPDVDLRMVTTNLTLGRPYTLPFDDPKPHDDPAAERSEHPVVLATYTLSELLPR